MRTETTQGIEDQLGDTDGYCLHLLLHPSRPVRTVSPIRRNPISSSDFRILVTRYCFRLVSLEFRPILSTIGSPGEL